MLVFHKGYFWWMGNQPVIYKCHWHSHFNVLWWWPRLLIKLDCCISVSFNYVEMEYQVTGIGSSPLSSSNNLIKIEQIVGNLFHNSICRHQRLQMLESWPETLSVYSLHRTAWPTELLQQFVFSSIPFTWHGSTIPWYPSTSRTLFQSWDNPNV